MIKLLSGTELITSKTLPRRLLDAIVLVNEIVKRIIPKDLINMSLKKIILSIENPMKPVSSITKIVIITPPNRKAILLS